MLYAISYQQHIFLSEFYLFFCIKTGQIQTDTLFFCLSFSYGRLHYTVRRHQVSNLQRKFTR